MTDASAAERRRIAAVARVKELRNRKVREGYDYQWWIDLEGWRLAEIVAVVLDRRQDDHASD